MNDARYYEVPVNGVAAEELAARLKRSLASVTGNFPPRTGVIVFAFDFHGGGMAYAANAVRSDCIKALEEWIAHQRTLA